MFESRPCFSAGEWFVAPFGDIRTSARKITQTPGNAHGDVCNVIDMPGKHPEEVLANAQLIAAAPNMFEALQYCVQWMDLREKMGGGERITDRALAALAKAGLKRKTQTLPEESE